MKNIKYVFISILRYLVGFPLSLIIWRSKKHITFWSEIKNHEELFMHNTKYLFLYLNNVENKYNYKLNWICNDRKMRKFLNQKGYKNVRSSRSLLGIFYALRSKIWLHDFSPVYLTSLLNFNAIFINLWHGMPIKKIEKDTPYHIYNKLNNIGKILYDLLFIQDNYFITNGKYDLNCLKSAFRLPDKNFKIIGSPRLDALYNDIPDANIFMEKDYEQIRTYKRQGKKVFFYFPTYRANGRDTTSWINSDSLKNFLVKNNAILICKLHFADINSIDLKNENIFIMNCHSDIHAVMKYSDSMITDYSSIYFDYLLLNKPIIYYAFDIDEFIQTSGLYAPYGTMLAGITTYNQNELLAAMQAICDGDDKYVDKRRALKEEVFTNSSKNYCSDVIEFIKTL